ncbi:MAG TPA: ABC transporter ATP-binding protein [candidate division Zixibacteria bacterium]|nr:ABC transporter ATP-binding protein [candidate division Zixibacteria bacterium]
MEPIIKIDNLTKVFGRYISRARITSLRNISFEIKTGERVCLFGPNGAGKSTIMKSIMGLIKPSSGKVSVNGLDVRKNQLKIKKMIGYLPSDFNFFLDTPCGESLMHFAILRGLKWKDAKQEVDRLLEIVGLTKWWDLPPKLMSSGMRQRFSLAMTIVADPDIILFDEPVSFIDVQGKMKIYQLVQEYVESNEKTILMSTHNIQEAMILSNRIIVVDRGQIIADGPIVDVVTNRCKKMEIILSEENPPLPSVKNALEKFDFEISGRKILIKSEDALQKSVDIINQLNNNKIPVFSFRPLIEQKRPPKLDTSQILEEEK